MLSDSNLIELAELIKAWAGQLGFSQAAISDVDLTIAEQQLAEWLANNFHGEMEYMTKHGKKRTRPGELISGTIRVISVRLDYLSQPMESAKDTLTNSQLGYISRYALGRDYHKVIRRKLQKLADKISGEVGEFGYRAFCDSAPVMEKALAQQSGLGWLGKHTNILTRDHGSWFFLGELYTDLPLPTDAPVAAHCGSCTACIAACPTGAIIAPYKLDARRCISYLTIELSGPIPLEFRPLIGNRIFGCDDCQLVCPWNKYAKLSAEPDFAIRNNLDTLTLIELFSWDEKKFLQQTEGSAIRRIGYIQWLRNIAVALGNAKSTVEIINSLQANRNGSQLVQEHINWALNQHGVN